MEFPQGAGTKEFLRSRQERHGALRNSVGSREVRKMGVGVLGTWEQKNSAAGELKAGPVLSIWHIFIWCLISTYQVLNNAAQLIIATHR